LAILAALVVGIRPRTLPADDRSGKRRRNQPREIDQVFAVAEDLHPSDFQSGGRNAAEAATVGAGAAGGLWLGGPGGAFAGATGAELLNRSGATGGAGEWAGGKLYDAISTPPSFDPGAAAQP
jgi:hypothetical protein